MYNAYCVVIIYCILVQNVSYLGHLHPQQQKPRLVNFIIKFIIISIIIIINKSIFIIIGKYKNNSNKVNCWCLW